MNQNPLDQAMGKIKVLLQHFGGKPPELVSPLPKGPKMSEADVNKAYVDPRNWWKKPDQVVPYDTGGDLSRIVGGIASAANKNIIRPGLKALGQGIGEANKFLWTDPKATPPRASAIPAATSAPTATPKSGFQVTNSSTKIWEPGTYPTTAPTSTPAPATGAKYFNYERFAAPDSNGWQPPQPPNQAMADLIKKYFPEDPDKAALLVATEGSYWDPNVKDNANKDSDGRVTGIDRGLFQVNSNTFNGLMQRHAPQLRQAGITSFEDMYDPEKNTIAARMILDEGGYGRWFGWQNHGYDLAGGQWSTPYSDVVTRNAAFHQRGAR